MSTSTTPSSTVDSPQSTIFGSMIDDEALAKENAAIDHLLAETELQLEEVARHVRGLSVVKDKEQLEFEAEVKSVMNKIDMASRKLDELDQEQDLKLRRDLIDMEGKVLGMVSCKISQLTIFGHKNKIKNFIKKFDIFHEKNSMAFRFWSIFGIKFIILKQKFSKILHKF